METINYEGLSDLSEKEVVEIQGGALIWKALAIASLAAYVYDHWECMKAGIRTELEK